MPETWIWIFLGFESADAGRPVQVWFDNLPEDHKDEVLDLLIYLQRVTNSLWRKPEFDPLIGAGDISEIRVPNIRGSKGSTTYRIYGYFGPKKHNYTFLHGTDKKARNDKHGKRIANDRLDELRRGAATVHEFEF